jgi:hypothetical protein
MPVQVEMRINGHLIETLHIGRIEGDTNPDSINKYIAVVRKPGEPANWFDGGTVDVEHRYGDMLQELVRKSLNAIKEAEENV